MTHDGLGDRLRMHPAFSTRRGLGALALAFAAFLAPAAAIFGPLAWKGEQFAFRDAGHYYYPLHQRIQQEWSAGRLPLWEPEENGGMPLLGNPTAAVLYPGKVVFALLPEAWAARVYVVAHVALAFAAMRALARSLGTSRTGATLAAVSYAFGAPVLFQYCNLIYLVGAAWAPLGFRAADRWLRLGRRWGLVELALVLAMQALGGDVQAAYLTAFCAFGYALRISGASWRRWGLGLAAALALGWVAAAIPAAWVTRVSLGAGQDVLTLGLMLAWGAGGLALMLARPQARVPFLGLAGACGLALLCAAVQLGPVTENVASSVRTDQRVRAHRYQFSVEPYRVVEWAWPNAFGTITAGNRSWLVALPPAGAHRSWSLSLYMGALTLVLALGAAGVRRGPPWRAWLSIVAGASLLAAFGRFAGPSGWHAQADPSAPALGDEGVGSVYWLLATSLPGFSLFRYPGKLLTFSALAFSCLAGLGWDAVVSGQGHRARALALGLAALTLIALAAAWPARGALAAALAASPTSLGDEVFGPLDVSGALADSLRGLVHGSLALLAAWAVLLAAPSRPRSAGAVAVLVLILDLVLANAGLVVTAPQAEFDKEPEALRAIRQSEAADPADGPFRVHRMPAWTPSGWSAAGSPRRLEELLGWEVDCLQPAFGISRGIAYTLTEESATEAADYRRFFEPFAKTLDARSAPLLASEPGRRVLYYPRRAFDLWNTRYFILPANPAGWTPPNRAYAAFLDQTSLIAPDPSTLGTNQNY